MLPIARPSIGEEEALKISEVLATGWLGHGSFVLEFERQLQKVLDVPHVVAVSTGTSALHLALDALGVGPGDEVIVPSLTFCGCVQAITATGATPVFCEVDPLTLNIEIDDAARRISAKTQAIMPIHFCGNPCDLDEVLAIAHEHNVIVIEDAAHAFGSYYHGKMVGSTGDITCFSFDPIKNITCGEGGAVVVSDEHQAELIRRKRMVGISQDGWRRASNQKNCGYEVSTQGYRYHMSNINAAIGLAQLPKLKRFRQRKIAVVRAYNRCFEGLEGLQLIDWRLSEACPFAYIMRVANGQRDDLRSFLATRNVGSGIHYPPNHLQPHFSRFSTPLPITESLYTQLITLPLFYDMTDDDASRVMGAVTDFFLNLE